MQKSIRILIVEDNIFNQKILSAFLKKLTIKYDLAESGINALEYLEIFHYDLVLMDIMMPLMDGLECTKKIRSHYNKKIASTPIVGCSASTENRCAALEAGMNSFLCKPLDLNLLGEIVSYYAK